MGASERRKSACDFADPLCGGSRTVFTSEDFEHLAWFLSRMVPDPAAGGRQSLRLYAMLVSLVSSPFACLYVLFKPAYRVIPTPNISG